jgi:SOS-response transcriptional repressor LexA
MTVSDNIKYYRKAAKLSQPDLAKLCGWDSQSRISNYETNVRTPSVDDLERIAKALKISLPQLLDPNRDLATYQELANYEIKKEKLKLNLVPLISWVQAGVFRESLGDDNEAELIPTDAKTKPTSYALKVIGDSMSPRFPEGMILIVDPDLAAIHNDFVIAKNGDNEATFKQLIRDGADWYLKPINPAYPIKSAENTEVIGVVIQAQSIDKLR